MKKKSFSTVLTIIMITLFISGCSPSKAIETFDNISEVNVADIIKYKDSFVGDNNAVRNILSMLPANEYISGISLQTEKKPYGIIVNFKENKEKGKEAYSKFWSTKNVQEFLEKNASVLFSLIQNADTVIFNVEGLENSTYQFTRNELEQKYGDLKSLSQNISTFKSLFQQN